MLTFISEGMVVSGNITSNKRCILLLFFFLCETKLYQKVYVSNPFANLYQGCK